MKSSAPISDLMTGIVLYNRMAEDIFERDLQLSFAQFRVLFFLSVLKEKQARIRDLADLCVLRPSTICDVVTELEKKGYVVRLTRAGNLKAVWVESTDDGKEALQSCCAFFKASTQFYWDAHGEEISKKYFEYGKWLLRRLEVVDVNAVESYSGLVYYIQISHRLLLSYTSWFKRSYNLGLIDVRILMLLLEWNKPLTCSDIAHMLSVSNSAVSNSVRYLRKMKKYAERHVDELDKRKSVIDLTEDGLKVINEIRERFIRYNLDAFGCTPDEFDEMLLTVRPRKARDYAERIFGVFE